MWGPHSHHHPVIASQWVSSLFTHALTEVSRLISINKCPWAEDESWVGGSLRGRLRAPGLVLNTTANVHRKRNRRAMRAMRKRGRREERKDWWEEGLLFQYLLCYVRHMTLKCCELFRGLVSYLVPCTHSYSSLPRNTTYHSGKTHLLRDLVWLEKAASLPCTTF